MLRPAGGREGSGHEVSITSVWQVPIPLDLLTSLGLATGDWVYLSRGRDRASLRLAPAAPAKPLAGSPSRVHVSASGRTARSSGADRETPFAFRLYDQPSRDFVRQRFGANRQLVRYDAALKTRGVAEQLLDGSVVADWDLTGLRVGQAVVGLPAGPRCCSPSPRREG